MNPPRGRVAVEPLDRPDIAEAVREAGGSVVPVAQAEALVWTGDEPELLRELLHPGISWVQLCAAGVDTWIEPGVIDDSRDWTAAKGVAARPIAEHALSLMLAAARDLGSRIRATSWGGPSGRRLEGTTAGILGCGGIGEALIGLLACLGVPTTALTRSGRPVSGAARSLGPSGLELLLAESDWLFICAPATLKTQGLIDRRALRIMRPAAWVVNVSRGTIIDTGALVEALEEGRIGGAALDVTDPEPLPEGHRLWSLPNVIITPHVATTPGMHAAEMCERVRQNVKRFRTGRELIGKVSPQEGY